MEELIENIFWIAVLNGYKQQEYGLAYGKVDILLGYVHTQDPAWYTIECIEKVYFVTV